MGPESLAGGRIRRCGGAGRAGVRRQGVDAVDGADVARALAHFRLQRLVVTLRATERVTLPWFSGSALRGGFGRAFRRLACAMGPRQPCPTCLLRQMCPYGYVFETGPGPDAEVLRSHQEVPRPYVMRPPGRDGRPVGSAEWVVGDERRPVCFDEGQTFRFELVLVGRAVEYYPYFVVSLRELGMGGLGAGRGRFVLEDVQCVRLAEEGRATLEGTAHAGEGRVAVRVYERDDGRMRGLPPALSGGQVVEHVMRRVGDAGDGVAVRFVTMTALKHGGRMATSPVFHVLVRAALRRLSSLSYFHHGERLNVDYAGLIQDAERVELVADETRWVTWTRWSSRQERSMDFSGLVGRAVYRGQVAAVLPVLALAEWVHVGKHATFGLGAIRLEPVGV